jgi:CHAT domain-containing protein
MVAQPSTPNAPPIPKTEKEVQIIHRLTMGARRLSLTRENATVERVREGMIESNWIHLACHGQQNPEDPMESGFLLHDKILKLSEIVKMSLPKADFAFLSACQTAMGDEKVAEESVHLAAGMFLSGCRGVIATMWSIRDDDGPKIAEDVYSRIFKDGKPNRKEAAYALHEAVRRLRESGAQCTSWVPFIHIGR